MDAIGFSRRSTAIDVTVTADGIVVLSQDDHGEYDTIHVAPDLVPLLCQWLMEAAAAIQADA